MLVLDAVSLSLSVLGIYTLILSLRYLIPCYAVTCLWARLNEAQQLLHHAEAIDAIPPESVLRTHLDRSANQFAEMRSQSNLARWPFQQLRLAIQCGLTCRIYVLYYRIESIKTKLELAIDDQQLGRRGIADSESARATTTAVPSPAAATVVVPTPSMIANHIFGGVAAAAATPANVVVPTLALAAMAAVITGHPSAPTATPVNDVADPTPALAASHISLNVA